MQITAYECAHLLTAEIRARYPQGSGFESDLFHKSHYVLPLAVLNKKLRICFCLRTRCERASQVCEKHTTSRLQQDCTCTSLHVQWYTESTHGLQDSDGVDAVEVGHSGRANEVG